MRLKRVLFAGRDQRRPGAAGLPRLPGAGQGGAGRDSQLVLGSATAIMAMGLARLGTPVAFAGQGGRRPLGRATASRTWRARGIDVSRVARDAGLKTGITVSITHPGDRALVTYLGAITALTGADVPDAALAGLRSPARLLFLLPGRAAAGRCRISSRARTAARAQHLARPGLRPERALGRRPARGAPRDRPLLPERGRARGRERLQRPRRRACAPWANGRTRVVAKLGEQGAMTLDGQALVRVPAYRVDAVDTTGAGDSFNAGFLHRWLQGAPLADCLRLGRGLRRAQHARARRHGGAADARGGRSARTVARVSGRYRWWIGGAALPLDRHQLPRPADAERPRRPT